MRKLFQTLFLSLCSVSLSLQQSCVNQKFVIIGAGVAGLSAAQKLKTLGCTDITVLEARNRIGGRINTENMGTNLLPLNVDMGASWIHGIGPGAGDLKQYKGKENPIYTLAKANKIKTVRTWKDSDSTEENYYWYLDPQTHLSEARVTKMEDDVADWLSEKQDTATPV